MSEIKTLRLRFVWMRAARTNDCTFNVDGQISGVNFYATSFQIGCIIMLCFLQFTGLTTARQNYCYGDNSIPEYEKYLPNKANTAQW